MSEIKRQSLPNRRPAATVEASFGTVTIGYDLAGRPKEVFANGPREGSQMQHILADACVVISIALQHGVAPAALAKSLGTVPAWDNGKPTTAPASPIGELMTILCEGT